MKSNLKEFIHLRNYSQYSLSRGAIKINELVKLCREKKIPATGISDFNNLSGVKKMNLSSLSGYSDLSSLTDLSTFAPLAGNSLFDKSINGTWVADSEIAKYFTEEQWDAMKQLAEVTNNNTLSSTNDLTSDDLNLINATVISTEEITDPLIRIFNISATNEGVVKVSVKQQSFADSDNIVNPLASNARSQLLEITLETSPADRL